MNRAQTFHDEWHTRAPDAPAAAGLLALPADQRRATLVLVLRHWLSTELHYPTNDLVDTVPLAALGLHRPAAAELEARLARLLRVAVPLADLAAELSLSGLVNLLLDQLSCQESARPGLLGPNERAEPLVFEQEPFWLSDQLQPSSMAAHLPLVLRLRGRLQAGALADSLNELVRRHKPLRASFATVNGHTVQRVAAVACVPLRLVDLRAAAPGAREAAWRALADVDVRQPFDLTAGPLCRAVLMRLEEREHVLLVTLHQAAAEVCPPALLEQELATQYAAHLGSASAAWPPPQRYAGIVG